MLRGGYAQHAFDLILLSPSSSSKQHFKSLLAKNHLGKKELAILLLKFPYLYNLML